MSVTPEYYPFNDGSGANSYEDRWRNMMTTMRSTGVVVTGNTLGQLTQGFVVRSDPGNLRVRVYQGTAWINGHMFRQVYSGSGNQYSTVNVTPNSSGMDRTDLVVIRADYTASTITVSIITGPGAAPTNNTLIWDLPLAYITVPDGATEILQADIEDVRVSSNQATFAPICILRKSTNTNVNDASTATLSWDTEDNNPMAMFDSATSTSNVIIKETGVYLLTCSLRLTGAGAGLIRCQILQNATAIAEGVAYGANGGNSTSVTATRLIELTQADIITAQVVNESGAQCTVATGGLYSPVFSLQKTGEAVGSPLS